MSKLDWEHRAKKESVVLAFAFISAIGMLIVNALVMIGVCFGVWWAAGSALTSGIKSFNNDCGEIYAIELVLSGDWFCPKEINTVDGDSNVL